ncbi:MAG TPA: hypothetical protein VGK74_20945 [Symbiobacteriaceae bacterium]
MIVAEAWRRAKVQWPALLLAGFFVALVDGLIGVVAARAGENAVLGFLVWGTGLPPGPPGDLPLESTPTHLAVVGLLGAAALIMLLAGTLAKGGLLYTVARAVRGEATDIGDLWRAAIRFWGRLFLYELVTVLAGLVLLAAFLVLRFVPVLGVVVWLLGAATVMLALGTYGPYMLVAEDLSVFQALGKAMEILEDCFGDVFATVWVLAGMGFVLWLAAAALGRILHLPGVTSFLVQMVWDVWSLVYLATRYELRISPVISPPGGAGTFHGNPPLGT